VKKDKEMEVGYPDSRGARKKPLEPRVYSHKTYNPLNQLLGRSSVNVFSIMISHCVRKSERRTHKVEMTRDPCT